MPQFGRIVPYSSGCAALLVLLGLAAPIVSVATTTTATMSVNGAGVSETGDEAFIFVRKWLGWTMSWTGSAIADGTFDLKAAGPEDKFAFDSQGAVVPHTFTGLFLSVDGALGSGAIATGSGSSDICPTCGLESATWTVEASGFLGTPSGSSTPYYWAESKAADPIALRPPDFPGGGGPVDLWIPISLNSAHMEGNSRISIHVGYESGSGGLDLLDMWAGLDGAHVTSATSNVHFFLLDSLGQDPSTLAAPSVSLTDIGNAFISKLSGDELGSELDLGVRLEGIPVPTTPFSDGSVAYVHIDDSAWNADATGGAFGLATGAAAPILMPNLAPIADVTFAPVGPGGGDASATLYALDPAGHWILSGLWEWNGGTVRSFAPFTSEFKLVGTSFANVHGATHYPIQPHAVTPFLPPILPNFSLGWIDGLSNEFNPALGLGGGPPPPPIVIAPGLSLQNVPSGIGANHWQYLPLQVSVQPDPSRPWLYLNGNPNQGYVGHTTLQLSATGLFDPFGAPIASLPLQVNFDQGPLHLSFPVQANQSSPGVVQIAPIDLGSILAQPYQLTIGVPGVPGPEFGVRASRSAGGPGTPASVQTLPGFIQLDAITATLTIPNTLGVPASAPATLLELAAPRPNPMTGSGLALHFTLPSAGSARVRILDVSGRLVRTLADGTFPAGPRDVAWDGRDDRGQSSRAGVYLVQLDTPFGTRVRRLVVMR